MVGPTGERNGQIITKTCLFNYVENVTTKKMKNLQIKNYDNFHISAQNIDVGTR